MVISVRCTVGNFTDQTANSNEGCLPPLTFFTVMMSL